jgi:hypothetical protein
MLIQDGINISKYDRMSLYHVAMVSLKNKIQGTFFKVKFQQPECSLNFFICQSIFHSPVGTYVNYVLRRLLKFHFEKCSLNFIF